MGTYGTERERGTVLSDVTDRRWSGLAAVLGGVASVYVAIGVGFDPTLVSVITLLLFVTVAGLWTTYEDASSVGRSGLGLAAFGVALSIFGLFFYALGTYYFANAIIWGFFFGLHGGILIFGIESSREALFSRWNALPIWTGLAFVLAGLLWVANVASFQSGLFRSLIFLGGIGWILLGYVLRTDSAGGSEETDNPPSDSDSDSNSEGNDTAMNTNDTDAETLFRFTLKRPPVEQSDETPSIELAQDTPLQESFEQAGDGDVTLTDLKDPVREFVQSDEYVTDYENLALGDRLIDLRDALDRLEDAEPAGPEEMAESVADAVSETMGAPAAEVVESEEFEADVRKLRDSIFAIKLLSEEHHQPLHRLVRALRDLELIRRVGTDDEFPDGLTTLRRYRRRSLELPVGLDGQPGTADLDDADRDDHDDLAERHERAEELLERFHGLRAAVDELTTVHGDQLVQSASESSQTSLPPAEMRPKALFERGVSNGLYLSTMLAPEYVARPTFDRTVRDRLLGIDEDRPSREDGRSEPQDDEEPTPKELVELARFVLASPIDARTTLNGRPAYQPVETREVGFRLTDEGISSLTEETRSTIEASEASLTAGPIDEVVDSLQSEMIRATDELDAITDRPVEHSFKRIGDAQVLVSAPRASPWTEISIGDLKDYLPRPSRPVDARIPDSHAEIAPAGVADLLVVKQQLTGYEPVDVSHVTNVLRGERRVRNHRRRRETEELLFRETETTTSEERELETTDRFEMVRETSETIQEEASLKAGLTVSGKYGPTVEFAASAEGARSRSKEQATSTASTFARETTQRSASKLTERILQRESLRVTNVVEDANENTFDNVDGDDHVSGLYQWLAKTYEAQIFNYGLRTMYDFMVPEPGAFLVDVFRRTHASALELEKPVRFTLKANQINEYNYHFWVHEYGATDVTPPPEPFRTKSLDYSAGGGDDKTDYTHSAQVAIDEGYRAVHASVGAVKNIWDDDCAIDVVIGQRSHRFTNHNSWLWSTSLDNERDSVPFALATWRISDIGVVVEVKCARAARAMDQWRQDTHAKLTQAYRARLSEYEEKLAALEAQAGLEVEGRHPAANERMMRDELKKACVTIMTDQHYDLFDAIELGSNDLPQIDLHQSEAEGPYVRFFEQAFEWEHMTWVTYPYWWGRKSEWPNRIAFEDDDSLFNEFLKAGYCRVSVPVREGFEGAVDHFMTVGDIWAGGPLPTVSSPLFLPIADELAERMERPGDEIPEGEPWELTVPTSLVHLRPGDDLPSWEKDEEGNWVAR